MSKIELEKPHDIQAEQSVLGAVMLSAEALEVAKEHLIGGEFYNPAHARIFRAMLRLSDKGHPIDLVSITSELQDSEEIDTVGGVSYLSKLASSVPTASNVKYYSERVKEVFLRRQAIDTALALLQEATQENNVREFVNFAENEVSKLSDQSAQKNEFASMKDVLFEVVDETEKLYLNKDINRGITGIESGFIDLDRMTAGFQKQDLIIVAARPSVGKTAFALNIARNAAIKSEDTIALFSLEMSRKQLVKRMVSAEASIDASKLRTGYFEEEDWGRMQIAISSLGDLNIVIDDTPGISANEIRSKCRRLQKETGLAMIIIDYLQLMQGNSKKGATRQEEVSEISRTLKLIARELGVPVIALSQLSRGVEQRQDKRPMMSDLRESGSIEQDADIVAFLYRDDYYDKESEKKNIIEIIIAKQRNGPVGTVEAIFLKNFNKFVNYDRSHQDIVPVQHQEENEKKFKIADQYRRK